MEAASGLGSRGQRIEEILKRERSLIQLELEDISYQRAGRADGEAHFNVRVMSKQFEGKSLVKRHRIIYDLLKQELQSGLHALSAVANTPPKI